MSEQAPQPIFRDEPDAASLVFKSPSQSELTSEEISRRATVEKNIAHQRRIMSAIIETAGELPEIKSQRPETRRPFNRHHFEVAAKRPPTRKVLR